MACQRRQTPQSVTLRQQARAVSTPVKPPFVYENVGVFRGVRYFSYF